MKIKLYDENGLITSNGGVVSSACIEEREGCIHLLVNTRNKWVEFNYISTSVSHLVAIKDRPIELRADDHIAFQLVDSEDESDIKTVDLVLIPESAQEKEWLSSLRYTSQDTDQIYVVMLKEGVMHRWPYKTYKTFDDDLVKYEATEVVSVNKFKL